MSGFQAAPPERGARGRGQVSGQGVFHPLATPLK